MRNVFGAIYKYWVTLMTAAVVLQICFAGYGAFTAADKVEGGSIDEDTFLDAFGPHAALGYLIVLSGLILLLFSFGAGGRRRIGQSAAVFGLLVVQMFFAWGGAGAPYFAGALHPLNAFVILAFLLMITMREWTGGKRMHRSVQPAEAPPG